MIHTQIEAMDEAGPSSGSLTCESTWFTPARLLLVCALAATATVPFMLFSLHDSTGVSTHYHPSSLRTIHYKRRAEDVAAAAAAVVVDVAPQTTLPTLRPTRLPTPALTLPLGFAFSRNIDVRGMELTIPNAAPLASVSTAAAMCTNDVRCSGFAMHGNLGDWRDGYVVSYKSGAAASAMYINPSMFTFIKKKGKTTAREEAVPAVPPVPRLAPPLSPPNFAAANHACNIDADCDDLAPPGSGRSALCLAGLTKLIGEEVGHCFTQKGDWLSRLSRRPEEGLQSIFIDGFLFNNEFDLLEIRLHELYPVVDAFVLVEAAFTFQDKPKPLYFRDYTDSARFARFRDKIVHVVLDEKPATLRTHILMTGDPWAIEVYSRDAIAELGIPLAKAHVARQRRESRESDAAAADAASVVAADAATELERDTSHDLIMITDIDEIPRRNTIAVLREFEGYPAVVTFRMMWSYFGFYWLHREAEWETFGACSSRCPRIMILSSTTLTSSTTLPSPPFLPPPARVRTRRRCGRGRFDEEALCARSVRERFETRPFWWTIMGLPTSRFSLFLVLWRQQLCY